MLIFDSGIGGLSILNYIKKTLPHIHYIYMSDNQFFPYGEKKESVLIERIIKIINIIKNHYPINIVILACNTASTVALSILRKKFSIFIIGVFPEIEEAIKKTNNKIIGLIATQATINSNYIQKLLKKYSLNNTINIIATNKLAEISEKKIRKRLTKNLNLINILKPWINSKIQPDTIILGCTHFYFLKKEIQKALNNPVYFFDSSKNITTTIIDYFYTQKTHQKIKENVFLYSKRDKNIKNLLYFLKKYKFQYIKYINLN